MKANQHFGYPFAIDQGLGAIRTERDYFAYVESLIKQVLFTDPGERINRPDFFCGLRRMIFTGNSEISANLAKVTILQALDKWLGEIIKVDRVDVKPKDEILDIRIVYVVLVRQERRYLNIEVTV